MTGRALHRRGTGVVKAVAVVSLPGKIRRGVAIHAAWMLDDGCDTIEQIYRSHLPRCRLHGGLAERGLVDEGRRNHAKGYDEKCAYGKIPVCGSHWFRDGLGFSSGLVGWLAHLTVPHADWDAARMQAVCRRSLPSFDRCVSKCRARGASAYRRGSVTAARRPGLFGESTMSPP